MVVLDYGHGEDTPGKQYKGFKEYKFNRHVGRFLEMELKRLGIDYHVLVPEVRDIALSERVARSKNVNYPILISIHGNAFKDERVNGIEVHYYSKAGKELAVLLQKKLINRLGWNDRGVKKSNFTMIKKTPQIAVLSENGFYTNDSDREMMDCPKTQFQIAYAHAEAIKEYLIKYGYIEKVNRT